MNTDRSLRVFISYSRKDGAALAEELVTGLEVAGFTPFLDRQDIAAGEDWEARLGGLIQSADSVVFVVSPGAIASPRCAWEVERASILSKRVVPVVAERVPDGAAPAALSRLNYIFFTPDQSFSKGLMTLATALRVDVEWVREHTRLGELAGRWIERGRPDELLLSRGELDTAKAWLAAWQPGSPPPGEAQREFITASEAGEERRSSAERRTLKEIEDAQTARAAALKTLSRRTALGIGGGVAIGGVALAASAMAVKLGNDAKTAQAQADKAKAEAHKAQNEAYQTRLLAARELADANLAMAQTNAALGVAEGRSVDKKIAAAVARKDIAGQFCGYACAPGENVEDDVVFLRSLVAALKLQDLSVQEAFAAAQYQLPGLFAHLLSQSQRPYFTSDLNGGVYLHKATPGRKVRALAVESSHFSQGVFAVPKSHGPQAVATWANFLSECGIGSTQITGCKSVGLLKALMACGVDPAKRLELEALQSTFALLLAEGVPRPAPAPGNTLFVFYYYGTGLLIEGQPYIVLDPDSDGKVSVASVDRLTYMIKRAFAASIVIFDAMFTAVKEPLSEFSLSAPLANL